MAKRRIPTSFWNGIAKVFFWLVVIAGALIILKWLAIIALGLIAFFWIADRLFGSSGDDPATDSE
ncbi:DUF4349 domain-containing protein [Sphingomonas alba]|uniref:DUF4349 domain-containing protein n=1 Tax=Sphingomonas alba TaxID=2908208 RepID=A0ABT0RLL9_9SPHN|nr:DUF4349 domain-containing protein [Sphingomonas alba]MCL6683541.1 DUF4349 domain-containing protein [Sphingomonas alba]